MGEQRKEWQGKGKGERGKGGKGEKGKRRKGRVEEWRYSCTPPLSTPLLPYSPTPLLPYSPSPQKKRGGPGYPPQGGSLLHLRSDISNHAHSRQRLDLVERKPADHKIRGLRVDQHFEAKLPELRDHLRRFVGQPYLQLSFAVYNESTFSRQRIAVLPFETLDYGNE